MPVSSPVTNPHQRHPLGLWSRDWADDKDDADGDADSMMMEMVMVVKMVERNGASDEDGDGSDNTKQKICAEYLYIQNVPNPISSALSDLYDCFIRNYYYLHFPNEETNARYFLHVISLIHTTGSQRT